MQKHPPEVFCKKTVLKIFANFTGKHLFFNKVACLQPASFLRRASRTPIFKNIWKRLLLEVRSSRPEVFCKIGVPRNFTKFTGKHLCQSLFLKKLQAWGPQMRLWHTKNEALAQVISCEFCENSKNTSFHRTPLMAASGRCCIKKLFLKTLQYSHDERS